MKQFAMQKFQVDLPEMMGSLDEFSRESILIELGENNSNWRTKRPKKENGIQHPACEPICVVKYIGNH